MTKLTELEKQKVLACVGYQAKTFEINRCKLEVAYDKLEQYDEGWREIEHAKEMEEFYSNLVKKLKEVL